MSAEEAKIKWLHIWDVMNQGDVAEMERLTDEAMAVDCAFHSPDWNPENGFGSEAQKAVARKWMEDHPDSRITIDDVFTAGDRLVVRLSIQAKNPETGAVDNFVEMELWRIGDGKAVDCWWLGSSGKW